MFPIIEESEIDYWADYNQSTSGTMKDVKVYQDTDWGLYHYLVK